MRMCKRLAVAAATVIAASGGALTVSAPVAYAAGGTAPACINRSVDPVRGGFVVALSNYCGKTMEVKVVVNSGGDSPCIQLVNGEHDRWRYDGWGSYDRTAVC